MIRNTELIRRDVHIAMVAVGRLAEIRSRFLSTIERMGSAGIELDRCEMLARHTARVELGAMR